MKTLASPASIRWAISTSPSRSSSLTVPISRRYMRTGSLVFSSCSVAGRACRLGGRRPFLSLASAFFVAVLGFGLDAVGLDHIDFELAEANVDVIELLGDARDLFGKLLEELLVHDEPALLAGLNQLDELGVLFLSQNTRLLHEASPRIVFVFVVVPSVPR